MVSNKNLSKTKKPATKVVKSKNLFEQLADIDRVQQRRIERRSKGSAKSSGKDEIKLSKSSRITLICLTVGMPFAAWALGALTNPDGWMSDGPSIVIFTFLYLPTYLWFISIPAVILLIYLLVKGKINVVAIFLFSISLAMSLYIFAATSSASESEFTG